MSIEEAAIFMRTSSIVLRGELQGAVSLYLHVPLRTWVYLFVSVREDDLPPRWRTLAVHKQPVNGNMSLAIISNPLLRATPRCAANLSPPVITLKTAGRAEENHLPVKYSVLSNCSSHIHRITGLILLYNHCSLFPLIVSLLNLFVCVHTLATQMFFCHANQAICVQGN